MKKLLVLALCVLSSNVIAQQKAAPSATPKPTAAGAAKDAAKAKQPPERPTPTHADVVYGTDSERQKYDFWKASSD